MHTYECVCVYTYTNRTTCCCNFVWYTSMHTLEKLQQVCILLCIRFESDLMIFTLVPGYIRAYGMTHQLSCVFHTTYKVLKLPVMYYYYYAYVWIHVHTGRDTKSCLFIHITYTLIYFPSHIFFSFRLYLNTCIRTGRGAGGAGGIAGGATNRETS